MLDIKFNKLEAGAKVPDQKTIGSTGFDLYPYKMYRLKNGRNAVPLGFSTSFPNEISIHIQPKSGQSLNGLKVIFVYGDGRIAEGTIDADVHIGVIDSDYRGQWNVTLRVHEPLPEDALVFVHHKNAIAQAIIHHNIEASFTLTDTLDETERGDRGFGKVDEDEAESDDVNKYYQHFDPS